MTSATIIAGVRSLIMNTNYFNARVFLRRAPENGTLPYVTIIPNMVTAPALVGDGLTNAFARQFSVDIWQKESAENDSIPVVVRNALDGAKIDLGTGRAWTIRVEGSDDIPEPAGTNIVHHTLTCSLKHDRSAL